MNFEIDVSGEDLLKKSYTICIANKDSIIKGFKFDENMVSILSSKHGQRLYKYPKSQKGKATFKIRIYSVIIYYLFKSLNLKEELNLTLCRDFEGRENDIRRNLKFFLEEKLGLKLNGRIYFSRLEKNSTAHQYAYLMRRDIKNKMQTYVKISLEDIEKWLKK